MCRILQENACITVVRISNDDIRQPISVEIANCNAIDGGCKCAHECGWKKGSRMRCVAKRDCDIGHLELRRYEIEHAIIVDVSKNKALQPGELVEIARCAVGQARRLGRSSACHR